MKILRRVALVLVFSFCFAHLAIGQAEIRIKIQASQLDRSLLFQKLNDHGADHHRRLRLAAEHVFEFCSLVQNLIEAHAHEI